MAKICFSSTVTSSNLEPSINFQRTEASSGRPWSWKKSALEEQDICKIILQSPAQCNRLACFASLRKIGVLLIYFDLLESMAQLPGPANPFRILLQQALLHSAPVRLSGRFLEASLTPLPTTPNIEVHPLLPQRSMDNLTQTRYSRPIQASVSLANAIALLGTSYVTTSCRHAKSETHPGHFERVVR